MASQQSVSQGPGAVEGYRSEFQAFGDYFQRRGGLEGLTQRFERAGLADLIHSWKGEGKNLPITVAQLKRVFPEQELAQLAVDTDRGSENFIATLAESLPVVVDLLTRNGNAPKGVTMAQAVALGDDLVGTKETEEAESLGATPYRAVGRH